MASRRPEPLLGGWIGLLLVLLLTGILLTAINACAPAVQITSPSPRLPVAYAAPSVGSVDLDRWWDRMNDPQLAGLVERGLTIGADARLALARLEEARAVRSGALARYGLQGDLRASATVQRTIRFGGDTSGFTTGGPGDPSSGGAVAALAGTRADTAAVALPTSWELDLIGRRDLARIGADADFAAARFAREASRAMLAAEIADTLFVARGIAARIVAVGAGIRELRSARAAIALGAARGLATESDRDRMDSEIDRADAERIAAETELAVARRGLLVLTGAADADLAVLPIDPLSALPPAPPPTLPGDLLRRRPDIRESAARLDATVARARLQRLELFPQFTLQPGVGLIAARGSFDYSLGLWTVAAGLSVPLFDHPRLLAMLGAEQARATQAVIAYERTVQQGFGEADAALVRLAADRRRLDRLDAAVRRADQVADVVRLSFEHGLSDASALLDAQRARRVAMDARTDARIDLSRHTVTAFRALGGGWTPREPHS